MFKKVGMLIALLWLMISPAHAEGIRIVMSPEVRVEGTSITLGQLADISGDDGTRVNSLRQLKLGSAAPPGSSVVLTRELVGIRLAATGFDLRGIEWEIPEIVTVTTNFQTVSGQQFLENGIKTIKQQAGLSVNKDFSINPIGTVQDAILPRGNFTLTSSLPKGIHYNIPTTVMTVVQVNGQDFTRVNLKFDVKLYDQVVVVNSQIGSGEILTADNLGYQRMDIGRLGPGYYLDMNKVLGLVTRRSLMPGMVLTGAMVNKPVLIKRGNLVHIIARIGSMEVTATGQAMQDGSEGQLIRVKNINSTKIISAKVLDGSTVQVLTYQANVY